MTKTKSLKLFIVLLAVLIISGVGYAAWRTNKEIKKTSKNVATQNEIDTTDWKTYRNEEYGFELQYPGDWNMRVEQKTITRSYQEAEEAQIITYKLFDPDFNVYMDVFSLEILNNFEGNSTLDWLTKRIGESKTDWWAFEKINIGDKIEGIKINQSDQHISIYGRLSCNIFFAKTPHTFCISLGQEAPLTKYTSTKNINDARTFVIKELFSTFRFIR